MDRGTPYKAQHVDKADRAKEKSEVIGRVAGTGEEVFRTPDPTSVEARAFLDMQASIFDEQAGSSDKQPRIEAEARDIVEGARQNEYGGPEDSFARTARLWNAHLQNRGIDGSLSPGDVALMMDLMKTARLITAPGHRDSIVDKIGYSIAYAKAVGVEP